MLPKKIEEQLLSLPHVSRETITRWHHYVDALLKWNKQINLIGPVTVDDVWSRHILDSAQLLQHLPKDTATITDFGAGAGLPGLVLAQSELAPETHLVESNAKKASFLRSQIAHCKGKIGVHNDRIEALEAWESDILTARALAPLPKLFDLLWPFIQKTKLCLFLKGQNVVEEIERATTYWDFEYELTPSLIQKESYVVAIKQIQRRSS